MTAPESVREGKRPVEPCRLILERGRFGHDLINGRILLEDADGDTWIVGHTTTDAPREGNARWADFLRVFDEIRRVSDVATPRVTWPPEDEW